MGKFSILIIIAIFVMSSLLSSIVIDDFNSKPPNIDIDNSSTGISTIENTRSSTNEDWPMYAHDSGFSKFSNSNAPREKYILWTFNETDFGQLGWLEVRTDPIVYDGKVFISTTAEKLYALDTETGKELWTVPAKIRYSQLAVDNDILVYASYDYYIYARNCNNGDLIWKYNTSSNSISAPIIHNGMVYIYAGQNLFTETYGGLHAFELDPSDNIDEGVNDLIIADYDLIWFHELYEFTLPMVWNDKVFANLQNTLWVFNASNGALQTILDDENDDYYGNPTIINNKLFLYGWRQLENKSEWRQFLGCYNPNTYEQIWDFSKQGQGEEFELAGSDNGIFFATNDIILTLPFNDPNNDGVIENDEIIRTLELEAYIKGIAVTQTELVVTDTNNLYCFDRLTGELLWDCWIYAAYRHSAPIIAYDKIFIAQGQGGYHLAHFTVFSSYPSELPNASIEVEKTEFYTLTNIKFDASGSNDDAGDLKYRFDFGDGYNTSFIDNPIILYNYSDEGVYTVEVKVKDVHGFTNRTKQKITVKNRIPILPTFKSKKLKELEYIYIKNLDEQIYDRDGIIIYFKIDYGDGTTWEVGIHHEGVDPKHYDNFDHEYRKPGKYTFTITVMDDDYELNTTSFKVTVEEKSFYEHVFPEYRWIYFGLCPAIFIIVIILIILLWKHRKAKKQR